MNEKTFSAMRRAIAAPLAAFLLIFIFAAMSFADSWTVDTKWYDDYKTTRGTKEKPFLISTPEELAGLAQLTNKVGDWLNPSVLFKGKYILLTRNIDLQSKEWAPIGWKIDYKIVTSGFNKIPNYKGFDGTFDGGGHTISGLSIVTCENLYVHNSVQSETAGLFGYLDNEGTVKNLAVKGSVNASKCEDVGGIAGWADGVIENCATDVSVFATSSKRGYAGGIAGLNGNPKGDGSGPVTDGIKAMIRNCVVFGNVSSTPISYSYAGGIVGFSSWYHGEVRNCVALCKSIIASMDAGGIFGGFNSNITANSVSVAAKVKAADASGIVGAYGYDYQNCYWLKMTDDQPLNGNASMGHYEYGRVTDENKLPVAAAIFDAADFGTIKPGDEREIHIVSYPTQADASGLKYTWHVDGTKLQIVSGQGTNTIRVKALAAAEDISYAALSADVKGLLGYTDAGSGQPKDRYISNFDTSVTLEATLKVASASIPVESVIAYGDASDIKEGETRSLGVAVVPSDADDTSVTWALTALSGEALSDDVILNQKDDGTLEVTLRKGHEKAYGYTFTVTAKDGGLKDSITLTGAPVTDVDISGVIPLGAVVPTYAEALKAVGATSDMLVDIAAACGVDISVFRTNSKGIVYLNSAVLGAAVDYAASLDKVEVTQIKPLPILRMTTSQAGKLAVTALVISGDALLAYTPQEVKLVKTRPDGTGEFFAYAEDQDAFGNKRFTLQTMDDKTMAPTDKIDPAQPYKLVLYIQDNSNFDMDPEDRSIIDPIAVVKLAKETPAPSGGSSGGCNAGAVGIMLLAVIPLFMRATKKKFRQ